MPTNSTRGALSPAVGSSGLNAWGGYVQEEFDPQLRGTRAVKVYDEMRRNDPTVATGLRAIKWVLGQVNWSVEPGGDTPADQEAAAFLGTCPGDMSLGWSRLMQDALTMLPFGWAYLESTYKIRNGEDGDPPSLYDDGRIGWRKWTLIGQDTLHHWEMDPDGGIRGMWQQQLNGGAVLIPIEKSVLFRLDAEKGNPEGMSLLRPVYLPWYSKKQIQEIEAVGLERDLTGLLVITPPVGVSDDDAAAAKELLETFRRDDMTGFYAPRIGTGDENRWIFNVLGLPGGVPMDTDKIIQRYQFDIARSFLTQFLMLGQTGSGSYALSRDQQDMFTMALGAILAELQETINRYMVAPLFKYNDFGRLTKLPSLAPGRIGKSDFVRFAQAMEPLVKSGVVTIDRGLQEYVREEFDLPDMPAEAETPTPETPTGQQQPSEAQPKPMPKTPPVEPEVSPETTPAVPPETEAAEPEPMPSFPETDEEWEQEEADSNRRLGEGRLFAELRRLAAGYDYAGKLAARQAEFRAQMADLARQMREGTMTLADWNYQSLRAIRQSVTDGYRLGLAQARGVKPSDIHLTPAQRIDVLRAFNEQVRYFADFRRSIEKRIAAGEPLTTAIDARAQLYGGSVRSAANEAKLAAEGDKPLRWVRHATDSCETCLAHDGQTKTAAEWHAGGVWPSHSVVCDGNCKCELAATS